MPVVATAAGASTPSQVDPRFNTQSQVAHRAQSAPLIQDLQRELRAKDALHHLRRSIQLLSQNAVPVPSILLMRLPDAHNSMFLRNKDYDVFNGSPEIWDFSENWGNISDTQTHKSKGDTANLRSIQDGRDRDAVGLGEVTLSNFLEAEQANSGSSLSLGPR
jgi:predicted metal-dependent hydrolase